MSNGHEDPAVAGPALNHTWNAVATPPQALGRDPSTPPCLTRDHLPDNSTPLDTRRQHVTTSQTENFFSRTISLLP